MPGVDLRLQLVSFGQKLGIARTQTADQRCKPAPEMARVDARAGNRFASDEIMKKPVDFQVIDPDSLGGFGGVWHGALPDLRAMRPHRR
jgi:hypothetical protein